MYVISLVISVEKKLSCWTLCTCFEPNSSIAVMLIGTTDLCHVMPLSVALILAEGHSGEKILLHSFLLC